MKRKVIITLAIITAIIVAAVAGTTALRDQKKVIVQGEVEVSQVKISSKLAGRVENLAVKEGQRVEKGEYLFSIATPEVDAKLRQALAAKNAAKAQQLKADHGTRKQIIASAYNLWQQAKVGVEFAQKSYERINNLYNEGVVPAQKRDEVKAQYDVAKENEKIAKAQYDMALEGAQSEDKMAARAMVDRAAGAVEEVESYLADASQYAPYTGEISKIVAENGELVATGYPVITIMDIDNPWIVFNVKESLLPRFTIGTKMKVHVPALEKDIEIEITSLAPQAEYATWTATRSKGTFDIRTFEVKAYPVSKNDGLRMGMTVVVNLDTM